MDAGSIVNKNAVSYYYCYFLLAGLTWRAKWFAAFVTLKSRCPVDFHKKVLRPGFNMDEGQPLATSSLRSLRNSWGRLLSSLDVWDSAVFSLNFSSAGKGPFIASKPKEYAPLMGEGVVEWGTMPGNLGARSSETSFPHFKTYFTQIGRCYL